MTSGVWSGIRSVLIVLCCALPAVNGGWAAADSNTSIIAHRGNSSEAPENTMPSFLQAWQIPHVNAELDIHLTADGQLVVCHDATVKRTTGVEGVIAKMTLAEIQKLDAGAWKSAQYAGTKMPALDEVIASIPSDRRLFIEIKSGLETMPAFDAAMTRAYAAGKQAEQMPIISFSYDVCKAVKKNHPELKVYWLSSFKKDKDTQQWSPTIAEIVEKAKSASLDGVDLAAKEPLMNADAVKQIRDAGLALYTWTVDEADVAAKLAELRVDGITTNKPAFIKNKLAEK